jgi:hypothetical protein
MHCKCPLSEMERTSLPLRATAASQSRQGTADLPTRMSCRHDSQGEIGIRGATATLRYLLALQSPQRTAGQAFDVSQKRASPEFATGHFISEPLRGIKATHSSSCSRDAAAATSRWNATMRPVVTLEDSYNAYSIKTHRCCACGFPWPAWIPRLRGAESRGDGQQQCRAGAACRRKRTFVSGIGAPAKSIPKLRLRPAFCSAALQPESMRLARD